MTNGGQEFSGKTVEEAIDSALARFGVPRDALNVEVLNKGSRGILGFGSEPALIRVSLKSAPATASQSSSVATAQPDAATVETAQPAPVDAVAPTQVDDAGVDSPIQTDVASGTTTAGKTTAGTDAEATPDATDDELVAMSSELLAKLVNLMGFEAEIAASWQEPDEEDNQPYLLLDIRGDDLGALIGRRGETLASLQYLLRLMVNQRLRQWKNIVVDVEQYKRRRVNQLTQLAQRMAQQVIDTDRSVTLEPMPANERRIIHLALRDDPQVFTESIGEGERRKVSIMPRH
jgi:spoIIIJ-associated protein